MGGKLTHPESVAAMVAPQYKVVALLHDAVEDGHIDARDLSGSLNHDSVRALILLTHYKDEETYAEYIDKIVEASGWAGMCARAVKLADNAHNRYGRFETLKESQRKRYDKARKKLVQAMIDRGEKQGDEHPMFRSLKRDHTLKEFKDR